MHVNLNRIHSNVTPPTWDPNAKRFEAFKIEHWCILHSQSTIIKSPYWYESVLLGVKYMEINDEGAKPTELFSSCWSIDLHLTPFILLLLKICKEIGKSGLGEYRCRYTCTLCVITMHFPSGERERGGKRLAAYVDRMAHTHTHENSERTRDVQRATNKNLPRYTYKLSGTI